jgi:hypothetical protein
MIVFKFVVSEFFLVPHQFPKWPLIFFAGLIEMGTKVLFILISVWMSYVVILKQLQLYLKTT